MGNAVGFAGFSAATRANNSNAGAIFATLKPFEERVAHGLSATRITQDLRQRLADIQEASIAVFPPPPVRGLGTAGGFKLEVQDRSGAGLVALQAATDQLVAAARAQPGLVGVFTPFRANTPQLYADVDRTKAKMLDVPLDNVFDTLQVYLGSAYVNDFNMFGRTYQVTAQADGAFRNDPSDILRLKTRNASGAMVPLGFAGRRPPDHRPGSGAALQHVPSRGDQRRHGPGVQFRPGHCHHGTPGQASAAQRHGV